MEATIFMMVACSRLRFLGLVYANLCAAFGFTGKFLLFDFLEANHAVFSCVNSVVTAHVRAVTSDLGSTSLTHQYCTSIDFLAAKAFHTQTLTSIVVDVLA